MDNKTAARPRRRLRRNEWLLTLLFFAGGILLLFNVSFLEVQFDMTPERRFSLSETTEQLLASFDEPVEIRYYRSDTLRQLSEEPARMERLLRRYDALGGNTVSVEIIDADQDDGQAAENAGLRGEELQDPGGGTGDVTTVYSGITVSHLGRDRNIPFLFGQEQLEYQLTNALFDVSQPREYRVSVMLGTEGEAFDVDYDELRTELSDRFAIDAGQPGEADIPADADAVILLGSRSLTDQQADALRSYLEDGGSVFAAADGLNVDLATLDGEPVSEASLAALESVLAPSGMTVEPLALMDSRNNELVTDGGFAGVAYPPWIATDSRGADPDHPVTVGMAPLDLFWPSPLRIDAPETGRNGPLVVTTGEAWIQGDPINLQPDNQAALERTRAESRGSYAIAGWAEDTHAEGSRIVAVADSDFASNLVFYTESLSNFMFVERSLLWLLGEDDMASVHVRSRQPGALDRIESPAAMAVTAWVVETVNTIVVPLLILLVGFLRLRRRRRMDQAGES